MLRQHLFQPTISHTRRCHKVRSDWSPVYLARLNNQTKENANNPYQRRNKIPLQKDPKVCIASGNTNVNIGLKMTGLQSKHVALYYLI